MSFDDEHNKNAESENRSPGGGDAAGESGPPDNETMPEDAPPESDWTRNERLRAWEEKIFRGELTLADVDEVLKKARLARAQDEAGEAAEEPPGGNGKTSARKREANRRNGRKSRGPVTAEGKQRVTQNLPQRRRSPRLLGLAEARTLNQDPEAAEQLYRQLIEPYGPTPPPLLALQFQDFARLQLELQAWERIRDAQLEARAEENDLERRCRLWEVYRRDLPGTAQEVFEKGLHRLPDSPAKFKRQMHCLAALKEQLLQRDFDIEPLLHMLYGQALDPEYDRAQTICIRCERLMDPKNSDPVTEAQFENLLDKVEEEEQAAREAYSLQVDQKTMTRSASLARLAPRRKDLWMDRRGEQLRRALDRKCRLIARLLQALGLAYQTEPKRRRQPAKGAWGPPKNTPAKPKRSPGINNLATGTKKPKPKSPLESAKRPAERAAPKPKPGGTWAK